MPQKAAYKLPGLVGKEGAALELIPLLADFTSPEVYRVYQACMYQPSPAKFSALAEQLLASPSPAAFGCRRGDRLAGVIALRQAGDRGEIVGIAVEEALRGQGLGSRLVRGAIQALRLKKAAAETDQEAVDFYRKCGFSAKAFTRSYGGREVLRYACVWEAPEDEPEKEKNWNKGSM